MKFQRKIDLYQVMLFATKAHASVINPDGSVGQRRKYTDEPYINHPVSVASIVTNVPNATVEMIAASLLHDVVEDTPVTLDEIDHHFGPKIREYVDWLTKKTTLADGNRAKRALLERERLAKAPAEVQTIKVADIYHNCISIAEHDPEYAAVYLPEKLEALKLLTLADSELREYAVNNCELGMDHNEAQRYLTGEERPQQDRQK